MNISQYHDMLPIFQSYNNNMRISARASHSALPEQRARTSISFRHYLIPKNLSNVDKNWKNNLQIHPGILTAISDQSQLDSELTLMNKLINLYKRLGIVMIPQNPVLICWQIILFVIINYYIFQLGFLLGFGSAFWNDELSYLFGLQIAFIVILLLDIIVSPLKAYYDQGLIIKDVSLILKNYGKVQLWLDLLAVISIIIPLAVCNIYSNWLKVVWILKIYSFLNIVSHFERLTQLYLIPNTLFSVFRLILISYLYSHFIGVFFYMVSYALYESNYYGPNTPNLVWVYNSWAFYQMVFLPWYQIYVYTMYFTIGMFTTIAYGDITPKNPLQCIYIVFALIFQTIIWGYLLSQIIRFLINVYNYNFTRRYHHYSLNFKLKTILIPQSTFKKVQMHTEEIDKDQRFRNREIQDQILSMLPPEPLYGVLLTVYKNYLYQMGFQFVNNLNYKSLGPADKKSFFLQQFMKSIHQKRFFAGDILYEQDEIEDQKEENHAAYCFTDAIYSQSVVLGVGQHIKIQTKPQKTQFAKFGLNNRCFQIKKPRTTFGQVQFLRGEERSHWAICVKNCLMFVAPRKLMLQNYHLLTVEEKEVIKMSQQKVKQASCLICRKKHEFKKCPYTFVSKEKFDMNERANRQLINRQQYRTRLKTMSSWRLFSSIRGSRITVSKQYKDRLFYDKAASELFVQLQLEEDCENQLQDMDLEHQLFETQVIIDNIYRQQLQQVGLSEEQWSCDTVYSYKYYKPASNVEQVSKNVFKKKKIRRNRKGAQKQ